MTSENPEIFSHLGLIFNTHRVPESDGLIDSQVVDCATHMCTLMIIGPFRVI